MKQASTPVALIAAMSLACTSSPAEEVPDHGICAVSSVPSTYHPTGPPPLSLVFVVDNAPGAAAAQEALAAQLPVLFEALSTGHFSYTDEATDQTFDVRFVAPEDVRVGVITSDMGTAGFPVTGCANPDFGDDGLLRAAPAAAAADCAASYPPVQHLSSGDDPAFVAHAVACLLAQGEMGCGFSAPLEAALKASAPSTSSLYFQGGGHGHGDVENYELFEPRRLTAFIVLSRRDDCSVAIPELFTSTLPSDSGDPVTRCGRYPSALQDVERYVENLGHESYHEPILGIVAGLPEDLAVRSALQRDGGPEFDFEAILDDPRMQVASDERDPTQLRASCTLSGIGRAYPPRRLLEVAQGLDTGESSVVLSSICAGDQRHFIEDFLLTIASRLGTYPRCLFPPVEETAADGRVTCAASVVLPPETGTHCDELAGGAWPRLAAPDGYEICAVPQVLPTMGERAGGLVPDVTMSDDADRARLPGWYFDDYTAVARLCLSGMGQPRFTSGVSLPQGAQIQTECERRAPISAPRDGSLIGESCVDPAADAGAEPRCGAPHRYGRGAFCHQGRCQQRCVEDADCPTGQRCEGVHWDADGYLTKFCADPVCGHDPAASRGRVGRACARNLGQVSTDRPWIELGADDCAAGPCLVDDPSSLALASPSHGGCDPSAEPDTCVADQEFARHHYCTCRCALPPGVEGDSCNCPHGFSCEPILRGASSSLAGSYCVRTP